MTVQLNALIFDLDGVITDTIELHYQAWAKVTREENVPFTRDDYDQIRGLSRRDGLTYILKGRALDAVTAQAWMDRKNRYFRELMQTLTPDDVLPGVRDWMQAARAAGMKVALGSASMNAKDVLRQLDLLREFDAIGDGWTVVNIKPAPDIFLWVAGRLDIHPTRAVVIEDSKAGIQAARQGGFWTVGVGKPQLIAEAHVQTDSLAHLAFDSVPRQLTAWVETALPIG